MLAAVKKCQTCHPQETNLREAWQIHKLSGLMMGSGHGLEKFSGVKDFTGALEGHLAVSQHFGMSKHQGSRGSRKAGEGSRCDLVIHHQG